MVRRLTQFTLPSPSPIPPPLESHWNHHRNHHWNQSQRRAELRISQPNPPPPLPPPSPSPLAAAAAAGIETGITHWNQKRRRRRGWNRASLCRHRRWAFALAPSRPARRRRAGIDWNHQPAAVAAVCTLPFARLTRPPPLESDGNHRSLGVLCLVPLQFLTGL